jgi:putative flippase GtrA
LFALTGIRAGSSMNLGRIFRFGMVGLLNTAIYFGCYLVLEPHMLYFIAHLCALFVGIVCSYFLNCYITFRVAPSWRTFARFPLSSIANVVITTAVLPVSVHVFKLDKAIAPLPGAVAAIPLAYVIAHYVMVGPLRGPAHSQATAGVVDPSSEHG